MTFKLDDIDVTISSNLGRWGAVALKYSMAVIFVWFGMLKPSESPRCLARRANGLVGCHFSTPHLAQHYWHLGSGDRCRIPLRRTTRIAIALLAMQMVGTFLPLVLLPDVTFQPDGFPFALTMEGQYIVKNILIVSSAMVLGGAVRKTSLG